MAKSHINIVVNDVTAKLIRDGAKETGMSVSRFAAYVLQTKTPECYPKERGQMIAFNERCEAEWKSKMPHMFPNQQKDIQEAAKPEQDNNDLLKAIKQMLQPVIEDNKMIKDELTKLKKDLGC